MIGPAAKPSTAVSAKFIIMNENNRATISQARGLSPRPSEITGPPSRGATPDRDRVDHFITGRYDKARIIVAVSPPSGS